MPELRPRYITFDCYGTLTNFRIAEPARAYSGARLDGARTETFVRDFAAYRLDEVLGAWQPYAEVIASALSRACRRHGIAFDPAVARAAYEAVPSWGPHADVPGPLARIAARIPLVILSNAMDEQIGHNVEKLGAPFHAVFTAQQAQSYKPRMRGFELMLDTLGARPGECMHVSSSLRYDHMTAHDLGYGHRVFVDRGHEPMIAEYVTHRVADIGGLAALLGL